MNNKSIDGLQRRSGKNNTNRKTVSTARASKTANRSRTLGLDKKKASKRKVVSIKEEKRDLAAIIAEGEALDMKNKAKDHDNSVTEYLSEIQDVDPTNLVEAPQKKKLKEWYKQSKKDAKKAKKMNQPKKKHKVLKRVVISVVILLILAGGGIFLYLNDFVSTITDNGNILNVLFSDPDTPLEKDENGRTNVLVFGTEGYVMDDPQYDGGWLTDAMMILSIDQDKGDVKAVSLPRDLKTEQTCTATSKMNEIYWCEYINYLNSDKKTPELKKDMEKAGGEKLAAKFEAVTGLKVHYRVHVNWKVLIDVVNALDGIDVCFYYEKNGCPGDATSIEVSDPQGLSEQDYSIGKTYFAYKTNTKYHLVGYKALQVARARNAHGGYGASGGNFSREYFQQRIIEAMAKKAKEKDLDLTTVLKIKQALGDNVRTNFKDTEIKTLLKLVTTLDTENLETISLMKANLFTDTYINGISYIIPAGGTYEYGAIKTYMKNVMKGDDFMSEEATIIVMNGTEANGVAANEKIDLEDLGYKVVDTMNAPKGESGFDGVRVYQISDKKPKTAKALKKHYNVDLQTKLPDELKKYEADFIVIIGNK